MANYTWRELNHTLGTKTEAEVLELLNEERANLQRVVVLERLHQRYNSLRITRERIELFEGTASKPRRGKMIPNGNSENWTAKVAPPQPEEQTDTLCKAGFVPSEVSGIADEMKQSLVGTLEKLITSIDEQQATIEKLQAINQELKSANEELRSAKVELQLPVEENVTVNSDLMPIPDYGAPPFSGGTELVIGISDLDKRIDEAIFDALNEFGKKCPYCSKNLYEGGIRDKMEIDHFIPISRGGQHFPWNLVPICKDCNRKKRAKLPIDFLSPEVFNRVNTYLLQVRQKFLDEGVVAHSSINSLRELLLKNEDVIRQLASHDFIKSLVHLVMPDRVSLLERPAALVVGAGEDALGNMIKRREDFFALGVIGSPFDVICDRLTDRIGFKVFRGNLEHALKKAGWVDRGRLAAVGLATKKHIFAAPDMAMMSKSELRRIVEGANHSASAADKVE